MCIVVSDHLNSFALPPAFFLFVLTCTPDDSGSPALCTEVSGGAEDERACPSEAPSHDETTGVSDRKSCLKFFSCAVERGEMTVPPWGSMGAKGVRTRAKLMGHDVSSAHRDRGRPKVIRPPIIM